MRNGSDDKVVGVDSADEQMALAINTARQTLSQFIAAFLAPKPNQKSFLLKAVFEEGSQVEHIWLADLDLSASPPTGVVANKPRIPGFRFMQRVPFLPAQITDWMYYEDDLLVGGFTTKLLKDRLA